MDDDAITHPLSGQAGASAKSRRDLLILSATCVAGAGALGGLAFGESDAAQARVSGGDASGHSVATPEDFGARGDARLAGGGWTGSDDTAAVNQAIQHLTASGGGDLLLSGLYYLDPKSAQSRTIQPDSSDGSKTYSIQYLLELNPAVRLVFTQSGGIVSSAPHLDNGQSPTVGILVDNASRFIKNIAICGGRIEGFTFGIAALRNTAVSWKLEGIRFARCAVAIYARSFEQVSITNISGIGVGSLVVVGGSWTTSQDAYSEYGGYCDKSTFVNLRLESAWSADQAAPVDDWFDRNIFRSADNRTLVKATAGSPATAYRYTGICGYGIRVMARYSRPSNANSIITISHQNAMRAAIRIDNGRTNTAVSVYCENVGYAHPSNRGAAFGLDASDPYLGPGRRLPNLVSGITTLLGLNAQFSVADKGTDTERLLDGAFATSNMAKP